MANLSFTTSNQIIRDLYDTAEAAMEASRALGCNGYRTYSIDGLTKYVPCSSFVQYENALRWRKAQGVIGAFGSDSFGDKLVGMQFANSKDEIQGDPFFTLGNFSINTPSTSTQRVNLTPAAVQNDAVKKFTISNIANRNLPYFNGKPYIETVKQLVKNDLSVKVLFDQRKLDNYVLYSSLQERFKTVLVEIYNNYPAAMKVQAVSIINPTVTEYVSYKNENRAEFKVSLYGLSNPFKIEFAASGTTLEESETVSVYRNFAKKFQDYVVVFNGVEYPIVAATLPSSNNDTKNGIRVTVSGDPFSSVVTVNNDCNVNFYIKPAQRIYDGFKTNLSDLAAFLLNYDADDSVYISEFLFPTLSDNGVIVNIKETVFFPMFDDYNLDMFSNSFDEYTTKLNDLATSYDSVKTNLIARFLTTDSLKEFDTEDRKFSTILQLYGRQFDEVKKYIDGIAYMTNVSYNKIENVPDLLIKNFAHMLGFETYEIEDENTLIESLFSTTNKSSALTPAEIDIELWRRIVINAAYLFKSKGTRKSIEFILRLVGFPDEIFDLNEFVYLAERPVDVAATLNKIYTNVTDDPATLLSLQPFDVEGYPTVPLNIKYQEGGGYLYENKENVGAFDFGKAYLDQFRKSGNVHLFELERTIDNQKSWAINTSAIERTLDDLNGYTNYISEDSRLTINSKEFEVYMAANRVFDVAIYRQYMRNIGLVNADLPKLSFDATPLSFNEFLRNALNNFINPKNRKTVSSYPTLTKVYYDYVNKTSNPLTSTGTLEFLSKFDTHWTKLLEQFVPATTIVNAGKKIQNSTFNDNKYAYRHGANTDVSWLGTDGSEFQQKALKPVLLGTNNVIENKGYINEKVEGDTVSFLVDGRRGANLYGLDEANNQYFGFVYSMLSYCDPREGLYQYWTAGVDYSDPALGGNINGTGSTITPRMGVFAIYNHELYRLNTRTLFGGTFMMDTVGVTTSLPPNIATATYGGVTKKIWDKIPVNVDARTITFGDSYYAPITDAERSFYMNTIGMAMAFLNIGIEFDCPPPKPHVCYFNYSGSPLNMITYTGSSYRTYVDETGTTLKLKQPKFYGYSRDYSVLRPHKNDLGYSKHWTAPYLKRFDWEEGKVYYKNEIIAYNSPSNLADLMGSGIFGGGIHPDGVYLVTGDTVTGYTLPLLATLDSVPGLARIAGAQNYLTVGGVTVEESTVTGATMNPGGMYERYNDRTKTDPFMQVEPAFITMANVNPNATTYSVNLSKSLNLTHIFSGATPSETFRVNENVVDGEIFISDSVSMKFDGLYPTSPDKIGPFYTLKDDNALLHTLIESLPLSPNTNNYVSIQSLNDNFTSLANDVSLVKANPGYYLVTKNSFLGFDFQLYFESPSNITQSVKIMLINSLDYVYDEQIFTFNGGDSAESRQYEYQYHGFFNAGERLYLNIVPIDEPCTLSRYETIEYNHTEVDESEFSQLNDPRFRVLFNSAFVANQYGHKSEGLSIKPIYNLSDLKTEEAKFNVNPGRYTDTKFLNILHSTDPAYLYNKLYLDYYQKFTTGETPLNTLAYDKLIGNDKVDFTFKVRSKDDNIPTPGLITIGGFTVATGVKSTTVEYTFNYANFYLGNTPKITEYTDVTNAITIGKQVSRRLANHAKTFTYVPQYSFYGGTAIGSGTTLTPNKFIGYNDGLKDFTELNYSTNPMLDIRKRRRLYYGVLGTGGSTAFNYYQMENQVYNTELYKQMLDTLPEFNNQIVNYELNDVVKVLVPNTKIVSGTTVVTKDVYRLYVCINDIHPYHCYNQGAIQGQIHPIYEPRGSRSCFIEIEKYNPANFTPWGYEERMVNGLPNPNVIDYVYKNVITYDSSAPTVYSFGDLVLGNYQGVNEYFRYIYQKPIEYNPASSYQPGDFVTQGVVESGSLVYRYFFARNPLGPGVPVTDTSNWTKLTNGLFSHKSLVNSSTGMATSGVTGLGIIDMTSWIVLHIDFDLQFNYSATVARLPKTLPITTGGTPLITTGTSSGYAYHGITYGTRWNNVLKRDHIFIDTGFSNPDNYEVINTNKILRNKSTYATGHTSDGKVNFAYYTGSTTGQAGQNHYETDAYYDYYNQPRTGLTNIYLKPGHGNELNATSTCLYVKPAHGETTGSMPLFERLCQESERNNPNLWLVTSANTIPYDNSSLYLGRKYACNRGALYQYINPVPVTVPALLTEQPCFDTTNWTEKDFCLVNNFTFYKDRTRVRVYEATIESLSTGATNNFYFFNPNLSMKSGFTSRSFSGTTINNQLVSALNKFYDVTDKNRMEPHQHGQVTFRTSGSDVIMDYHIERDEVGYPLTGEFMGKLSMVNPCGQSATTFFGIVFNTDVNKLDRQSRLNLSQVTVPQFAVTLPYVVRVIINQSSNATVDAVVTTLDSSGSPVSDNFVINKYNTFDQKFYVTPGSDLTLLTRYSTNRKQTYFKSAGVDNTPIFVNNALTNTNTIKTSINTDGVYETRTVTLKGVSANTTIYVNLAGVEVVSSNILDARATFNVKNINISAAQL